MALLTEGVVRDAAATELRKSFGQRSAHAVLAEAVRTHLTSFDVFLSHSRLDAELVLGVKNILGNAGKTVYVDWLEDPQLDRSHVTAATADVLRKRMDQCDSLFYIHSRNATQSRWMPWELGYFDGRKGNVAILPILKTGEGTFHGEEYLGLYPYIDFLDATALGSSIWIHRNSTDYTRYERWLAGTDKKRP